MNILVVGATGPLGREIVSAGINAGHIISALVRNPATATLPASVKIIPGDVLNAESLDQAVTGQDIVINSLGSKISFKPMTLLSEGTRRLTAAMTKQGVKRLICITGIGAGDSKGHGGFVYDNIIQPLILNEVYKDKTRQEHVVRDSGLDWTLVRPAMLTNGNARGLKNFRVISNMSGLKATAIARKDVALYVMDILADKNSVGQAVVLTA